jgi:hypothetical protein
MLGISRKVGYKIFERFEPADCDSQTGETD